TNLPDEVRTRVYPATVTPQSGASVPANTFYAGTVTGGTFALYSNGFWIGVAGDYLGISTDGDGPGIVEQIGPNRYVAYAIDASASGVPSNPSTISAPFTGLIEYCELKAPIGQYYDCSPSLAAVREQCTATNGRLTLTRR